MDIIGVVKSATDVATITSSKSGKELTKRDEKEENLTLHSKYKTLFLILMVSITIISVASVAIGFLLYI